MKPTFALAAVGTLILGVIVQQHRSAAEASPATTPAGLVITGTVHSIHLPDSEPPLPPGAGRDTVQIYCGMCHTTHYIMIQPPFPRETWLAEVTKMRKTFSGPIPEEKIPEIIAYLMNVRGVEAK